MCFPNLPPKTFAKNTALLCRQDSAGCLRFGDKKEEGDLLWMWLRIHLYTFLCFLDADSDGHDSWSRRIKFVTTSHIKDILSIPWMIKISFCFQTAKVSPKSASKCGHRHMFAYIRLRCKIHHRAPHTWCWRWTLPLFLLLFLIYIFLCSFFGIIRA